MKKLNFIITGGGTGGHLVIAKAIKDELNKREIKPIFIGSKNGADKEWFGEDKGFSQKYFFNTNGVVNQNIFGKLFSLAKIFFYAKKCQKIFKKNSIDVIFSVGGYSAGPASIGASWSGLPLFIHEQNSKMGSLNKILSSKAKVVFNSYQKKSPIKDYPVAKKFFDYQRVRGKVKTVIFLGGSQGAKAINDFALTVVEDLKKMDINIIHQTGKKDFERINRFYEKNRIEVDIFPFSKNIVEKMAKADFAVSRSGASTLWELVANNLPTLFVPYPYAYQDHQYYNAKFLEEKNLTFIKRENELSEEFFLDLITKDFTNISTNLQNTINPNGVEALVDFIFQNN